MLLAYTSACVCQSRRERRFWVENFIARGPRLDEHAGDGAAGQTVDALVHRMARVAGDLMPGHVVCLGENDSRLPQIAVLHGFLLSIAPAVLAPADMPLVAEAVDHVRAVTVDRHLATLALERAESLDRGHELHPLVGGLALPPGELALVAGLDDDGRPPAGAWIAGAGAVGEDRHGMCIEAHLPLTLPSPPRGRGLPFPLPLGGERIRGRGREDSFTRASRDNGRRTRTG